MQVLVPVLVPVQVRVRALVLMSVMQQVPEVMVVVRWGAAIAIQIHRRSAKHMHSQLQRGPPRFVVRPGRHASRLPLKHRHLRESCFGPRVRMERRRTKSLLANWRGWRKSTLRSMNDSRKLRRRKRWCVRGCHPGFMCVRQGREWVACAAVWLMVDAPPPPPLQDFLRRQGQCVLCDSLSTPCHSKVLFLAGCEHPVCRTCLARFVNERVGDGSCAVKALTCPVPSCAHELAERNIRVRAATMHAHTVVLLAPNDLT